MLAGNSGRESDLIPSQFTNAWPPLMDMEQTQNYVDARRNLVVIQRLKGIKLIVRLLDHHTMSLTSTVIPSLVALSPSLLSVRTPALSRRMLASLEPSDFESWSWSLSVCVRSTALVSLRPALEARDTSASREA